MLVYETLNKFYTGDDITLSTPLTSDYLNSIITQIEDNFGNLDDRVEAIEQVIIDKTIYVDVANIKTGNIDTIINNSLNSSVATINSLSSSNASIDNLTSTKIIASNTEIEASNIKNLNSENMLVNEAKINTLQLESLKISENYIFNSNEIDFIGTQPALKFSIQPNSSNGIRIDSNNGYESFARIEYTNESNSNEFTIEFNSENDNDQFNIISNTDINISANNINLNANIIPQQNSLNIGNDTNPLGKIVSQQFYGSYFSYNADLAELYETDENYEPGTILSVGFETEATIYDPNKNRPILGVVSEKPAILLNTEKLKNMIPIALKGRVFCKLSKKGNRGDWVIPDENLPGVGKPVSEEPKNKNLIIGILIDPENNIIKV
jgi:hypothetical protein